MRNLYISFIFLLLLTACSNKQEVQTTQNQIEENESAASHISILELEEQILPKKQNSITFNPNDLLKKRFSVFEEDFSNTDINEAFWALKSYKYRENKPYFASNLRPIPKKWFIKQHENANKEQFLSLNKFAITVKNTAHRNLPTDEPLFYNPLKAGEGYPFDYLQISTLSIAYPLFISHLSKDKAWAFAKDDSGWGWVSVNDINFLSKDEALSFKNSNFISILEDKTPIYTQNGDFLFYARVGAILPFLDFKDNKFIGKIYTPSGVKIYEVSKEFASHFPLKFDDENVNTISQTLLSQPYGWGGTEGLRDCSLMTKDFFASFGIWLPRNSKQQSKIGKIINLEKYSNQEKRKIIKEKGIPYQTLLYMPGHIMIYIGQKDGEILAMHESWGLRTKSGGRAIIGQTAITKLDIGANSGEIFEKNLLISKVKSMNILGESLKTKEEILPNLDYKKYKIQKAYGLKIIDNFVIFKDKDKEIFDDKKAKDKECSSGADIEDMVGDYKALSPINSQLSDVGRCRNYKLLAKIYGNSEDEVRKNLADVYWIKSKLDLKLKFNKQNGAAKALQNVSDELNLLVQKEPEMLKFVDNPAGTFKWRKIAKTNRLSAHSFAIAIDLNVDKSHYWQWNKAYANLIPEKIVHIFEKNGFIWGGRWKHFDTMHFEFRPELINFK